MAGRRVARRPGRDPHRGLDPPPGAFQQSFVHSTQGLHSWYMLAFQLPWLPEKLVGAGKGEQVRKGLVKGGLTDESAADSARLLADPATARTMINWYRGLPFSARQPIGKVEVPTVYVWSDGDAFLGRWAAEHTADWVTGPYRFVEIAGGTHWIPEEHPDRLADAIRAVSSEYPRPAAPRTEPTHLGRGGVVRVPLVGPARYRLGR